MEQDEVFLIVEYITQRLNRLNDAHNYDLEAEVILWALKAMKENPNLTIIEALEAGCNEWDV